MRARVFKFCIQFESGQDAEINSILLFPISHSNVKHEKFMSKIVAKYIVGQKTKLQRYIWPFLLFPSLTPVYYLGKIVSNISHELLHPGFGKLVQIF